MLSTVFSEAKTRSIIDVMPDEMIVWKVVSVGFIDKANKPHLDIYTSIHLHVNYLSGENKASNGIARDNHGMEYQAGFHSWVKKDQTAKYMSYLTQHSNQIIYRHSHGLDESIISCQIQKKDIVAIGREHSEFGIGIVTSHIIMPTYPNADITKELSEAPLIEECVEAMELMNPISDGSHLQEAVSCGMDVGR